MSSRDTEVVHQLGGGYACDRGIDYALWSVVPVLKHLNG